MESGGSWKKVFHAMENFFVIFPHNGKNGGLRATFGPRSEAERAFGNPCAKHAIHTVENLWTRHFQAQEAVCQQRQRVVHGANNGSPRSAFMHVGRPTPRAVEVRR